MPNPRQTDAGFDAGQQHLGNVYAKALLGATQNAGNTETVLAELQSLVEDVLDKMPQLEEALVSPRIGHAEKERILDRAFGAQMSRLLLNFLKTAARHNRLNTLRSIQRAARRMYNEMHGRREVQLHTAAPVDEGLLELIANRLRQALGGEVDIRPHVDPELIGGIVIRVDDTVYDGSVANRLARMRDETLNSTIRQIRRTLDRFAVAE